MKSSMQIDSLKDFIKECGGLGAASLKLNVNTSTLAKIISGKYVSAPTKIKVADCVKELTAMAPTKDSLVIDNNSLESRFKKVFPHENSINALSGLGISPSTIRKILEGKPISAQTRQKAFDLLGGDPIPSGRTISVKNISSRDKLKILIGSDLDLLKVSSSLKVGPTTIQKILNGVRVSPYLEMKIKDALERINSLDDLGAGNPRSVDRLLAIYKMYQEEGTLEAVGKKIGLTKERVRQLLASGTRLGLFIYKPYDYPYVPKEKLIGDYIDSLSLHKVARINKISPAYLKKLMTAYSITEKELSGYGLAGRKKQCIEQYNEIVGQLGHHPKTTELVEPSERRSLWARISRVWGSFDAFRKELGIPTPAHTYPHWLEPRNRLALIARMQHLDTVRECLSASNPKSVTEIAVECDFNLNRVRRLLKLLIAAGEVQQAGVTTATKYRLIAE